MPDALFVDPPGLEPRKAEPESAVLPLHHGSIPLHRKGNQNIFFDEGFTTKFFK